MADHHSEHALGAGELARPASDNVLGAISPPSVYEV